MTFGSHKLPVPIKEYVEPASCSAPSGTTNKPPAKLNNSTTILDPAAVPKPSENFPFYTQLDQAGDYHLYWKLNTTHITFETHVRTLGYVGFGFSSNGKMFPSDVVIGWVKDGVTYFKVYFCLFNYSSSIETLV